MAETYTIHDQSGRVLEHAQTYASAYVQARALALETHASTQAIHVPSQRIVVTFRWTGSTLRGQVF